MPHARRGGIQHVKACRDCDATELEKSEAIVRVSHCTKTNAKANPINLQIY